MSEMHLKKPSFTYSDCGAFAKKFELTKFHCLVAFNSWDTEQYVYFSSLLTRMWRHEFKNKSYLSNQVVFSTWPKSRDNNLNILRTKRAFKMK